MEKEITPKEIRELLEEIRDYLGTTRFALCGGTITDFFLEGKIKKRDVDIAVEDKSQKTKRLCKKSLVGRNFEIVSESKPYYIFDEGRFETMVAKKDNIVLDIVFISDVEKLGFFDIEKVYCRYNDKTCTHFGFKKAISKGEISPIKEISLENPHMVMKRALHLCSKYGIPLKKTQNINLLTFLAKKSTDKKPKTKFEEKRYESLQSTIIESILYARDKKDFIKGVIESNSLFVGFPYLKTPFLDPLVKKDITEKICEVKDKKSLILLFSKFLDKSSQKNLVEDVNSIAKKRWGSKEMEDIGQLLG